MNRSKRLALVLGLGSLGLLILTSLAGFLVLQTDWFHEKVRQRIVREVERASGGRAEIGSFSFDWRQLRAIIHSFVLHGNEASNEPPLFRAQSVEIGLNIASVLKRDIDISLLRLEQPRVYIAVYADGNTNLPQPKIVVHTKNPIEQVLALQIRRFSIEGGLVEIASKKISLDVRGEYLNSHFFFEPSGPRYTGQLSFRQLDLQSKKLLPVTFDMDSSIVITRDRLEIPHARFAMEHSSVQVNGVVNNPLAPEAEFGFQGDLSLEELSGPLRLPMVHQGAVKLTGKASIAGASGYAVSGHVTGNGLEFRHGDTVVRGVRLASDLELAPGKWKFRRLKVSALGGDFSGAAELMNSRHMRLEGEVKNFPLQGLSRLQGPAAPGWSGFISGLVGLQGDLAGGKLQSLKGRGRLALTGMADQAPVQGSMDVAFDEGAGTVEFGDSYLATPSSRVEFSGTLQQNLRVELESRKLKDFFLVTAFFDAKQLRLPVALEDGAARFSGTIRGKLQSPNLSGHISITNFALEGRRFDRFEADVALDADSASLRNIGLAQDHARLEGDLQVGLREWRPDPEGTLKGSLRARGMAVTKLLAEAGHELPLSGTLSGSLRVAGSLNTPEFSGSLLLVQGAAYGQRLDQVRTEIRYSGNALQIASLQLVTGSARVRAEGTFTRRADNWRHGTLRYRLSGNGISLSEIRTLAGLPRGVEATIETAMAGEVITGASGIRLTELNGRMSLKELRLDEKPAGNLLWIAETKGDVLNLNMKGKIADAEISGFTNCSLQANYPVEGEIQFTHLALSSLRPWWQMEANGDTLPLNGFAEGKVGFSGPALAPADWTAHVAVTTLELSPEQEDLKGKAYTVRNSSPILLEMDQKTLRVERAEFTGEDTNFRASGTVSFKAANAFQLRFQGGVNLSVLHNFEPDLTASGHSTFDATIRGPLSKPELYGRLDFKDASFYLSDVPNGIDKARGVIFFFRDRATIEEITAETGGGRLTFSGFVGYGSTPITYRLRASAEQVRVRYPEGVSTSLNSSLTLTGTSSRSLLSGTVTILRSAVTPRVDFAGLLARSSKPLVTPATQNELLRGMQFDIRIQASPDATFETALTKDIQPEADLRLRGTPYKPVLLGRVSVSQGEINFLGNRYNINRGEISFLNPARLEPAVNLDLETRVRGIDVTLTFTGPLDKLNVTYRSDPPLQVNEIIALLAVGRAPTSDPTLAARQAELDQSWGQIGASTLIGQALAAPVAGRLQRFFGVSRIKIDPQLTGVENNPQAQLTLEQQVSKDVTFTYITNLSTSQQQVVRVEWNVSREWSVLAVREQNGLFGIDFLYRKQFK
jgi:translocation and assembly module TamB